MKLKNIILIINLLLKCLNSKQPFITQKDIDELTKHGVDFEKDMKVFLKELKAFLIATWAKEFHKDIDKLETHGLKI